MSELTLQEYTQEIAGMLERGAYEEAVAQRYRFYSLGDCMLII